MADDDIENDGESESSLNDFRASFDSMSSLGQGAGDIPEGTLPKEHPLWLVMGFLSGIAKNVKDGGKPQAKDSGLTNEALKRIENSVKEILQSRDEAMPQEKPVDAGKWACVVLAFCCLLLFVWNTVNPPQPQGMRTLVGEMRSCKGPDVMRLKDGRCTMRYEYRDGILRIASWPVEEK